KSRWGLPFASLLGALNAQLDLGLAAIGGKDSMSGSFEELDVPPTLISFAAALGNVAHLCSPEWKQPGSKLYLLAPTYDSTRMPESRSLLAVYAQISALIHAGHALSTYALCYGGAAAGLLKMALGNGLGCRLQDEITLDQLFAYGYGSFLVEVAADAPAPAGATLIGEILPTYHLYYRGEIIPLLQIEKIYNARLENVFPCHPPENTTQNIPLLSWDNREQLPKIQPRCKMARPRVLIPVFPGTNCEYDTAAAFARVGAEPHIEIIRNINSAALADSVAHMAKEIAKAQIIMIPGGFSGGDEPDGSGKFITAFFRNPLIREAIETLLDHRDGLMGGICNGFQALIKLGLVPFGHIRDAAPDSPTLTFNTIGRHQSRLIRSRITAIKSPWLSLCQNGDIHTIAISHGEGRFVCAPELLQQLAQNGQIAAQYVDDQGLPTMDIHDNPNGSYQAVEAVTSPDGRIFGRMGHPERATSYCLQNIPGDKDAKMFAGAVAYFTS
ncbi:MAG: phosphoribosylformylglycinamidine synthase subunit PurQ, partial [Clostridiales bacterium]